MKNRLQYAYSILVFIGVLLSAYLMLEREKNDRLPLQALSPNPQLKEATVMDPVVNQLFEFEEALTTEYAKPVPDRKLSEENPPFLQPR